MDESDDTGLLQHHRRKYLCRPLKAYIFCQIFCFIYWYFMVFYGIM